jgi:UDP-N-acetylglucosamine 2-epimerase (non-hydrolysing)
MKAAPLVRELQKYDTFLPILLHTGQHYDYEMSKTFFEDLDLPEPDIYLGVGSGSHAEQTAKIMVELERVILKERPDLIVVFGDVNSTLAAAVVTAKLLLPLAHVEAGLRSFDRSMPEEINRVVTDALSDYLFTTEKSANRNLKREGISEDKIYFVGNIMIDTLLKYIGKARRSTILKELNLYRGSYVLLTLHRPSNVDIRDRLEEIMDSILEIAKKIRVIFPAHPRTVKNLEKFGLIEKYREIEFLSPLKYTDFLSLEMNSNFVMTDSGGIQEETTYLGVPCLTLRENTERPVTVEVGTNIVVGTSKERILEEAEKILNGNIKRGRIPELWDGKTSERIVEILLNKL